ncbi:hypothetical protein C7455_104189 [Roseicyclus mahoneyensis]|uniref:Uncharacterized protein n=1 Tax=Roseicyclus mahoneyensis TaxID=164332 RepID=A0A316GMB2_9RHOB|nr:hypothetical protein C7455_104189 [Roseicyclus mahoneyensis]
MSYAFSNAFADDGTFKFGKATHQVKLKLGKGIILGGTKGQAFRHKANSHTLINQGLNDCLQIPQIPCDPINRPHKNFITFTGKFDHLLKGWSIFRSSARKLFFKYLVNVTKFLSIKVLFNS